MGEKAGGHGKRDKQHCHNNGLLKENSTPTYVTGIHPLEHTVKPVEKSAQQSMAGLFWTKQESSQGRTERERVEGGEQNGNRDGHRKLLIKSSRNAGDESSGHENGG